MQIHSTQTPRAQTCQRAPLHQRHAVCAPQGARLPCAHAHRAAQVTEMSAAARLTWQECRYSIAHSTLTLHPSSYYGVGTKEQPERYINLGERNATMQAK